MNTITKIISGLSMALAVTLAYTSLGLAAPLIGTDYENGRVVEAAIAMRVPVGYHMGVANGSDFENSTIALPEGAKGSELLVLGNFAEHGERLGPVTGSDWENLR